MLQFQNWNFVKPDFWYFMMVIPTNLSGDLVKLYFFLTCETQVRKRDRKKNQPFTVLTAHCKNHILHFWIVLIRKISLWFVKTSDKSDLLRGCETTLKLGRFRIMKKNLWNFQSLNVRNSSYTVYFGCSPKNVLWKQQNCCISVYFGKMNLDGETTRGQKFRKTFSIRYFQFM